MQLNIKIFPVKKKNLEGQLSELPHYWEIKQYYCYYHKATFFLISKTHNGEEFLGVWCGIMISSKCPKKAANFLVFLLPYVANNFHHNISVEIEQNVLIGTKLTQVTHHSIWQVTVPRQLKVLCSRWKVTNKYLSLSSSVFVI